MNWQVERTLKLFLPKTKSQFGLTYAKKKRQMALFNILSLSDF